MVGPWRLASLLLPLPPPPPRLITHSWPRLNSLFFLMPHQALPPCSPPTSVSTLFLAFGTSDLLLSAVHCGTKLAILIPPLVADTPPPPTQLTSAVGRQAGAEGRSPGCVQQARPSQEEDGDHDIAAQGGQGIVQQRAHGCTDCALTAASSAVLMNCAAFLIAWLMYAGSTTGHHHAPGTC